MIENQEKIDALENEREELELGTSLREREWDTRSRNTVSQYQLLSW